MELPTRQNIARLRAIDILNRRYRVIHNEPPIPQQPGCIYYGGADHGTRTIYLNPKYQDTIIATLWHEIVHVIDDELHLADDYREGIEPLCNRMGYALSTVRFTYRGGDA